MAKIWIVEDDLNLANLTKTVLVDKGFEVEIFYEAPKALKAGRIFAAGLDVFEGEPKVNPELLKLSNVVLAPHVASATEKTRRAMVELAIENLRTALDGKKPPSLINTELFKA